MTDEILNIGYETPPPEPESLRYLYFYAGVQAIKPAWWVSLDFDPKSRRLVLKANWAACKSDCQKSEFEEPPLIARRTGEAA